MKIATGWLSMRITLPKRLASVSSGSRGCSKGVRAPLRRGGGGAYQSLEAAGHCDDACECTDDHAERVAFRKLSGKPQKGEDHDARQKCHQLRFDQQQAPADRVQSDSPLIPTTVCIAYRRSCDCRKKEPPRRSRALVAPRIELLDSPPRCPLPEVVGDEPQERGLTRSPRAFKVEDE